MPRALGVDVGQRRHDAVLWDGATVTDLGDLRTAADLSLLLHQHSPDVVAVDSPPRFARERPGATYREAEGALRRRGIHAFYCPPADRAASAFYDWMRAGFELFEGAASSGYLLATRVQDVPGRAIEVFPHGAAVVLARGLPPPGSRGPARRRWREDVLAANGMPVSFARRAGHRVDAALAALTGFRALHGAACAVGDPTDGVIFLPVPEAELLDRYERAPITP